MYLCVPSADKKSVNLISKVNGKTLNFKKKDITYLPQGNYVELNTESGKVPAFEMLYVTPYSEKLNTTYCLLTISSIGKIQYTGKRVEEMTTVLEDDKTIVLRIKVPPEPRTRHDTLHHDLVTLAEGLVFTNKDDEIAITYVLKEHKLPGRLRAIQGPVTLLRGLMTAHVYNT